MKNLKSKLFESLKLSDNNARNCFGGAYTSSGSDTNMQGGSSDVAFNTLDASGKSLGWDTAKTSIAGDTKDKPVLTTGIE
jgi:hypothetical protein